MIEHAALQAVVGPSLPHAEIGALGQSLLEHPQTAIRLAGTTSDGDLPFHVAPVPWNDEGRFVSGQVRPSQFLGFAGGDYFIQDAGSLLALALLDIQPNDRVCDLCASPGGKATGIAKRLGVGGWLLANEPVHSRLGALHYNLARYAPPQYAVSQADPHVLAERLGAIFDWLLVDAPCSGQSLVSRGKQSMSAFDPKAIALCAARQQRILNEAARLVRPGGRLVYSTCTLAVEENEAQIEHFLRDHPGWHVHPCARLAAWESPRLADTYRLWPHRDRCGGAFAAALRRADLPTRKPARRRPVGLPLEPMDLPDEFGAWGQLQAGHVAGSGGRMFAWPEPLWQPLQCVTQYGPEIAHRKGKTWFPAHALALRDDPLWTCQATLALESQTAEQFWRGHVVPATVPGWAVACWESRRLGWIKSDGKRGKNHLPKAARRV